MRLASALVALTLLVVGCQSKPADDDSSKSPQSQAAASPSAAASSDPASAASDEAVTEAAYEEEAEQKVGTDNLESEVEKLEKEIAAN